MNQTSVLISYINLGFKKHTFLDSLDEQGLVVAANELGTAQNY